MSPCNVTLARHLEQVRLRAEYLRQQRARPPARPALLVAEGGGGTALVASVRLAPRAGTTGAEVEVN